ncbi:hypothetical protein ABG067_007492, partial [Albugo candida]
MELSDKGYKYFRDNKVRSWPAILQDIQKRRWLVGECGGVCIVSNGLKEIIVLENIKGSCDKTLANFLTPEDAQDTSTTHSLPNAKPRKMLNLTMSTVNVGGEDLMFAEINADMYFDDEKEEAEKSIPIEHVQFNFLVDHLVVPSKVFESFESSKKKQLSLQLPLGLSIKVSEANVTKHANKHQGDHYVFGKVVLEHLQYIVEESMNAEQIVLLGLLNEPKARPIYKRARTFIPRISTPSFIKTLRRT